jgi:hypothetical protein
LTQSLEVAKKGYHRVECMNARVFSGSLGSLSPPTNPVNLIEIIEQSWAVVDLLEHWPMNTDELDRSWGRVFGRLPGFIFGYQPPPVNKIERYRK